MAIDTQGERMAVANLGKPVAAFLPVSDTTFGLDERLTLLRLAYQQDSIIDDLGLGVHVGELFPLSVTVGVPFGLSVHVGAAFDLSMEVGPP